MRFTHLVFMTDTLTIAQFPSFTAPRQEADPENFATYKVAAAAWDMREFKVMR